MGPIDYSSAFSDLPPPQDAMLQGLKMGAGMREAQDKRAAEEAAAIQRQQMQADMAELSQAPTAANIARFSAKYPQLSEPLKRTWDMVAPAERQAKLEHATQVYAAFNSDKPEIGAKLMRDQAAALRNSGDERSASATEAMANLFEHDPTFAKIQTGKILGAMAGPEKFAEAFAKIGAEQRAGELQGDLVRKGKADAAGAEADAQTKAITAKYADSQALADLAKKQWDVRKITADIEFQRESNRIAAMNAAASREGNALKKQELQLKLEEARTARDDKVREKVAKAEAAATSIDNMINTVDRLLQNPALNDVLGSIEGRLPSVLSDDGADAIGLAEQLGSQAFLSQVPTIQGMGALSNAEGEKLQAALQNFKRTQSEEQFRKNLKEVQRLVLKGRENISKRYGVPLGAPDRPDAPAGDKPPIDSFFR